MDEEFETHFAPAERKSLEEVKKDTDLLLNQEHFKSVLDALPNIVLILNSERQIVFTNDALLKQLGLKDFKETLSARPGEILHCIHSDEMEGGCGTSRSCRYCGAVNSILQSQKLNRKITDECRITSKIDGKAVYFDLEVTASPYVVDDRKYTFFYVSDISSKKRRELLERTFFHDILNTSSGIQGLTKYFPSEGLNDRQETILSKLKNASIDLLDEIQAQRDLLAAEQGRLSINVQEKPILNVIQSSIAAIHHLAEKKDITVKIQDNLENISIQTDIRLLRRIFINLLKNAIEASKNEDLVEIGCNCEEKSKDLECWVQNPAAMSEDVKSQIFQRSFSTKGAGRGVGTYSIKLLTEQYLNGTVRFTSQDEEGTTFYISLPKNDL